MGNPVVHFEVVGNDLGGLKSVYSELFGWKTSDVEQMPYATVDTDSGSDGITGGLGEPPPGQSGHVTFYVQVDDIPATVDKIESLGGKRVGEPFDIPGGGQIGLFTDPQDHLIGLWRGPSS